MATLEKGYQKRGHKIMHNISKFPPINVPVINKILGKERARVPKEYIPQNNFEQFSVNQF